MNAREKYKAMLARREAGATHYLDEWPDGVGDQLCYNDDVWGGVEEWIEHLIEDHYEYPDRLRAEPDRRHLAECSRFASLRDRLGNAADLAETLLDRTDIGDAEHFEQLHEVLAGALYPALAGLPGDQGWYEGCDQYVYITAGELLAIIEEDQGDE